MKDLKDFQRVLDNYGIAYTVGSKDEFEATLSRLDELMESVFFSTDSFFAQVSYTVSEKSSIYKKEELNQASTPLSIAA